MPGDEKVWNFSNLIITAMAVVIAALVSAGFYSLTNKIESGDALIYSRMSEIKTEVKGVNDVITNLQKDVTRIDVLQKQRLEREAREEYRRNPGSR